MKRVLNKMFVVCSVSLCLCGLMFVSSLCAVAQTSEAQAAGVLRLRVRTKSGGKEKGLARKRFYLIKGSKEEHKALLEKLSQQTVLTRECYYRQLKASEAFIGWLREGDCESVYCRPVEEKFLSGADAVPE
ncbi:MAG: hypothetical protein JO360_02070, partial [Acidobacteria bacterium]|nr:hypothetical protein [Acidobacteriota bacterium]